MAKPKNDAHPLTKILHLIRDAPHEWSGGKEALGVPLYGPNRNIEVVTLTHVSGVAVLFGPNDFWIRPAPGTLAIAVDYAYRSKFQRVILEHAVARTERPALHYDSVMHAMARAVLGGDRVAAKQLADAIMELEGGTAK